MHRFGQGHKSDPHVFKMFELGAHCQGFESAAPIPYLRIDGKDWSVEDRNGGSVVVGFDADVQEVRVDRREKVLIISPLKCV